MRTHDSHRLLLGWIRLFATHQFLPDSGSLLSWFPQAFLNPKWIAPQIQNGINVDYVFFHLIIDTERESFREHPMELKVDWMNTGKKN